MAPLLKRLATCIDHPFEYLDESIVKLITRGLRKASGKGLPTDGLVLLRMLECFLQITNRRLVSIDDFRKQLPAFDIDFEGAIWSTQFVGFEESRRYRYSRVWKHFKSFVETPSLLPANSPVKLKALTSKERSDAVVKFENLEKNQQALWYWSGWQTKNLTGKSSYVPLGKVYKSHGYNFSKLFYDIYCSIVCNQRAVGIPGTNELLEYLSENSENFSSSRLKDPKISKLFWTEFRSYYFKKSYSNGSKLQTIGNIWHYSIMPLAKRMVSSGIVSAPQGGMPKGTPTFYRSHTPNHRTGKDGSEENIKLTFPIPLHTTDDEAIELIFGRVQKDQTLIKKWAKEKIDCIEHRINQLQKYATKHLTSLHTETSANDSHLEGHCFSVYNQIGFTTNKDVNLRSEYKAPLTKVASILPLPTSSAVIPFAYFLVAHHSEITPEFLMGCNLYDKNGMISGLEKTDAGWYLVGNKYRKGAELAEQKILLNHETYSAVKTLITLTEPARQYLKSKSDPSYRSLFLRTGKGFGVPQRVKELSLTPFLRRGMVKDLRQLGASNDHAELMCEHCTLTSVRALGGVSKYIETESLVKASKALGHTRFDYKLLARYIPKPLLTFFSDRWIRIFQQGLILEAMHGSPYALAATDFDSEEEVHQFLSKHSLKIRKDENNKNNTGTKRNNLEVVFCIDETVLSAMLKISNTTSENALTAKQLYWSRIAKRLINHIESDECSRPDFQEMLSTIKAQAA